MMISIAISMIIRMITSMIISRGYAKSHQPSHPAMRRQGKQEEIDAGEEEVEEQRIEYTKV